MMILGLAAFVSAGAENYFRNGTVWTVSIKDTADPTVVTHQEVYSFGDEVKIGDMTALKMMRSIGGESTEVAIVRQDGEKVYFYQDEDWRLVYDFSLKPEERLTVFSADPEFVQPSMKKAEVECERISNTFGDIKYDGGILLLKVYDAATQTFADYSEWLNGIGGLSGPMVNYYDGIDGHIFSELESVEADGNVIFQKSTAVESILTDENVDSKPAYRLDGTPDNGTPGIIIKNGKKIIRK